MTFQPHPRLCPLLLLPLALLVLSRAAIVIYQLLLKITLGYTVTAGSVITYLLRVCVGGYARTHLIYSIILLPCNSGMCSPRAHLCTP